MASQNEYKNGEFARSQDKRNGGTPHISGLNDPDEAYKFLARSGFAEETAANTNIKALKRKVEWHIVPIMFLCYAMQFVDKVSLNYAAVMGLPKDLKLKGNDFSNAATAFFIAYLVAEIPNGFILNKVPVAKWLGANVILWGIATACTAATRGYGSLLSTRIFLGIFDAAIAPCIMLISSQYYTKEEQAPRFSLWYCGLGVAQIFGGIVSYGFQQVHTPGFQGWRIMFVFLGVLSAIVGICTFIWLPDTPMTARFLSEHEKSMILHHVAGNQTGVQNRHFKPRQILEILMDVQMWLMTLITILISISSGVVTTYSSTLIRNIGYKSDTAALLNMPSGLVSIASTMIVGLAVRYGSQSESGSSNKNNSVLGHRWLWLALCCVPGILGGGLLSFLPSSKTNHNKAGLLAGIYLVNAIVATLAIVYQWTAANVAGHTKRVVSMALIAGSFSVGNIIGPQTFQAKDAPQFIPAKITVLATQGAVAVVVMLLALYYRWANRRKNAKQRRGSLDQEVSLEKSMWDNLTDKENPRFRYVY